MSETDAALKQAQKEMEQIELEETVPVGLSIDEVVAWYVVTFRHKPDIEQDIYGVIRCDKRLRNLNSCFVDYSPEELIKAYFDLLKAKHEAVDEERYEAAEIYQNVLDNLELKLFPYKCVIFHRKFISKLEELGKTEKEINYAIERFMLNNVQAYIDKKKDEMGHDKRFYSYFVSCVQAYLENAAASQHSPKFIEAFTGNYMD